MYEITKIDGDILKKILIDDGMSIEKDIYDHVSHLMGEPVPSGESKLVTNQALKSLLY